MKHIFYGFVFIFILVGCHSLNISAKNVSGYNNGIAVMQKSDEDSKIQVEVGQGSIGGAGKTPLLLYVMVENLKEEKIIFDTNNVFIKIGDTEIYPMSFERLKYSNIDFRDALYDYGIESNIDVKINEPYFSPSVYRPLFYPIILDNRVFLAYRFYDYPFSNNGYYQARIKKANEILVSRYLRKNTLEKNSAKGGFVAFSYSDINRALKKFQNSTPIVMVKVGNKSYSFDINIYQKKKNDYNAI